jgi:hypothetical protein
VVFGTPDQLVHVLLPLPLVVCLFHLVNLIFYVHLLHHFCPLVTLSLNREVWCVSILLSLGFFNSLLSFSQTLLKSGQLIRSSPFWVEFIQNVLREVKHRFLKLHHC